MGNSCGSEKSVQTVDQGKKPAAAQSKTPAAKPAEKTPRKRSAGKNKTGSKSASSDNLDIYSFNGSPPALSVLLTCAAAGIKYNHKEIDIMKGEHKTPEFLKINPNHCVPTIKDGDFCLTESRAIMIYLVSKYAPDSGLYPSDLQKRACVDRWLNFDMGSLLPLISKHVYPALLSGKPVSDEDKKALCPLMDKLNSHLGSHKYLAGDALTIADFGVSCSLTLLKLAEVKMEGIDNVHAWFKRMMELPYFKDTLKGLFAMKEKMAARQPPKPENLDIYVATPSTPCRAIMMTCAQAGIEYNCKELDMMKGEHKTPEYEKINPNHKVPTINDNGFILDESRAALIYLVSKYAPHSGLYPQDLQQKALVDRWLHYDIGTAYPAVGKYVYPMALRGEALSPENKKPLVAVLDFINSHLCKKKFLVGDAMTIADISLLASISFVYLTGLDLSPWKHLKAWIDSFKALSYFKEANRGLFAWKQHIDEKSGSGGQEKTPEVPPVAATVASVPAAAGISPVHSDGITLYWYPLSPFARSVYMVMKSAGVDFKAKELDLLKGEHKTDEYTAINPGQSVPAIVDGDFALWESRAIMTYVLDKCAPDNKLYPSDLQKRAVIDRWLNYDLGTWAPAAVGVMVPAIFGIPEAADANEKFQKCLEFVESHLEGKEYICGDCLSLADVSMYSTLVQVDATERFDCDQYKNVTAWMKRVMADCGGDADCARGIAQAAEMSKATKAASKGLTLFWDSRSPFARSAYMSLKLAGIDFNVKDVDLSKGEHQTAEYAALNPTKKVPALRDGNFTLWESRAIVPYVLDKYAGECSLYPSDLQKRAMVDRWLHTLFHSATYQKEALLMSG